MLAHRVFQPLSFFSQSRTAPPAGSAPAGGNRAECSSEEVTDNAASQPNPRHNTINFNYPGNFCVRDNYDSDDTLPLPPDHPFWRMEFVVYQPSVESTDEIDELNSV